METGNYNEIQFSDSDVVNYDDWIPKGEFNPHNVRPFLLHDHGFVLAVVFADCLQDALDIATDAKKMERFKVEDADLEKMSDEQQERLDYLGNFGVPHDTEGMGVVELPNPPRSWVAQFNAEGG